MTDNATIAFALLCSLSTAAAQSPQQPPVLHEADGRIAAFGDRFTASFDTDGASVRSVADEQNAHLKLSLTGYRRGSHYVAADGAEPQKVGDHVQFTRGANCVANYAIDAQGFEQSFRFDQRPAGDGDLILSIRVEGNVHADAFAPAHRGISFRADDGSELRYSEAYAFGRGSGRVDVQTSFDGVDTIELIVPEKLVDSATYPLVVDPAVGPVMMPNGTSLDTANPDVAFDPVHGTFLVVYDHIGTGPLANHGIRGRRYDTDGVAEGSWFNISSVGAARRPAVAFIDTIGHTGFFVVWEEANAIFGRLIDGHMGGAATAPKFQVSDVFGWTDQRPTVSGGPDVIVAWDRTPNGATHPNEIRMRAFTWPFVGSPPISSFTLEQSVAAISGTSGYLRAPRLAQSNVRCEVAGETWTCNRLVWERFYSSPAPGDFDVRTASIRVSFDTGALEFTQPVSPLLGGATVGVNELRPAIAARASAATNPTDHQFCVAWQDDDDVVAQMYDMDGPVGSQIVVRATPNFEGIPTVAAGHCEFTVGYGESLSPFAIDIRAARVLLDGTVAVTDRAVDVQGGPFQTELRSASQPIQDGGAEKNTTMLAWREAVGTGSSADSVRCRLYEPVVPTTTVLGTGCFGPGGELPAITPLGDAIAGSTNFGFAVTNAPPSSLAVLMVSDTFGYLPLPGTAGCTLYLGLPILGILPTLTNSAGWGSVGVPLPCAIPDGVALAFQWGIYTPGHGALEWIVSNDVDVSWAH